jgi:hypothetical protein
MRLFITLLGLFTFYYVVAQEPLILTGTIEDFEGENSYLEATAYGVDTADGLPLILGSTPIATDGSFTLELRSPIDEELRTFTPDFFGDGCRTSISDKTLQVMDTDLNYFENSEDIGFAILASSSEFIINGMIEKNTRASGVALFYANTSSKVQGLCRQIEGPLMMSVNIQFEPGWNFIAISTVHSSASPAREHYLMTNTKPEGYQWYLEKYEWASQ